MEGVIVVFLVFVLAGMVYLAWQLLQMKSGAGNGQTTELLFQQINELRRDLETQSQRGREEVQNRLDSMNLQLTKNNSSATEIIKDVTEKLTKLDETNKQVVNFAEQMKSLENILKNPKQRGILGEFMLETLLANVLAPGQYEMQYKFPNGEIVDAVVFFNDKIIPIDAKFSLEKYNLMMLETDKVRRNVIEKEFKADVKKRIDETSKYIRPEQDTTEFAFMFIPAEGIYYNLMIYNVGGATVNTQDLIEYAFSKKVIIVSPTSFFAYLETVLQGLKALKMEESVKEIIKKVSDLSKHLNMYEDYMKKVGNHLGTTVGMYNNAYREYKKIDKDVYKITSGETGGLVEPELLEKPTEHTN